MHNALLVVDEDGEFTGEVAYFCDDTCQQLFLLNDTSGAVFEETAGRPEPETQCDHCGLLLTVEVSQ